MNVVFLSYKNYDELWNDFKNIETTIDTIITIYDHEFSLIWRASDEGQTRHYMHGLANQNHISDFELSNLIKFLDYESKHNRTTGIWCENQKIEESIKNSIYEVEKYIDVPLPSKITVCKACKHHGCLTDLLCHTASLKNGLSILKCGSILSSVNARQLPASVLYQEKRNAAGDPYDYFDYVMLTWGNCQAGDRLVVERELEKFPDEIDLGKNFQPGIRFYFNYSKLNMHPNAVFDGFHPLKVKHELVLNDYLLACIVPIQYKEMVEKVAPKYIEDRIHYLNQEYLDIWDWSKEVYEYVKKL